MEKPQLDYWKGEIKSSIKRQNEEFLLRINYNELIKYLEGQQGRASWTIIDEFSPAILSVVTNIMYQLPTVDVQAATPDADKPVQPSLEYLMMHPEFRPFQMSDLLRGSLAYGMKKSGMKEELQVACFDLMLAGFACVEVNQTLADGEQAQADMSVGDDRQNPIMDAVVNGAKSMWNSLTGQKSQDPEDVATEVAETTQKDIRTDISDETYCKRWSPLDVYFDPRATVFKESRWIGKRIRMSLAEFNAKYPRFKGKVTAGQDELPDMYYSEFEREENRKSVTLYEIEIKKKGPRNCILVCYLGIDEPIDYYERPIISNDFAIKYAAMDKYGKLYPMSRAKKAKKNQYDINHYATVECEHADRAQRKIAFYGDGLTESGKAAQSGSDPYALVEKKSPQNVYEVMPAPSVVPEVKEIIFKSTDSLNKAIGTTELAKSGESQNDTLGQDELQSQAFQSNVNSVQDALGDLANDLIDELKDIILQLWDGKDYFRVTGIQGGDAWYDPAMGPLADILLGDYTVNVNITSAQRPNPLRDRKEFMEFATYVTSPPMMMFAQMHGKRPSMEILNSAAKKFDQNPEMIWEELQPMIDPLQPQGPTPPQPNANLVQSEGSRMADGADQVEPQMGGMA